jgi:SAM-dependent methyltransferase
MDTVRNHTHWSALARAYGTDLAATTKCRSIKVLEIGALSRAFLRTGHDAPRVLEVGCGNALNGAALCQAFPRMTWTGCDAVPAMVESARERIGRLAGQVRARMRVVGADARTLEPLSGERFDVVYTDRCLINLASLEEQVTAAHAIAGVLADGGWFLMLENSRQTHARLNAARRAVGLPFRPAAEYNVFVDEEAFVPRVRDAFDLEGIDDFGGLHDVLLYALKPAAHEAHAIVYDDALMDAATRLALALAAEGEAPLAGFGQNRLWRWRKRAA